MLIEFEKLRQDKNGYRRLFSDDNCDLYMWYDNEINKKLIGFQIVYKINMELKALTWTENEGFFHLGVDEGKNWYAQTPLLVEDGIFEYQIVKELIKDNIENTNDEDLKFALVKVREFGEWK